jgi:hypothetical protein
MSRPFRFSKGGNGPNIGGSANKARKAAKSVDKRVSALMRARRQQRANVFSENLGDLTNFKKKKIPKTDTQSKAFLEALNSNFLFKTLSDQMKKDCIDALEERKVNAGEIVINQVLGIIQHIIICVFTCNLILQLGR